MRILQINATYGDGSTGTIVRDIQRCCEENKIDCHVAYAFSSIPEKDVPNGYKMGNWLSNKYHALMSRISGKQGYYSRLSTLFLLRHISNIKPDVVHLHNLHSNYIHLNVLLKYLAKKDIATVVTLHDCWFYTGGCFHYTNDKCNKWLERCGNCPKRYTDTPAYLWDSSSRILSDRYEYFGAINNLTVVGVSEWITREAQRSVFKGKKCTTIYNGVDMGVFKPTPSDIRERYGLQGKFVILGPASKWLAPVNEHFKDEFIRRMPSDTVLFFFGCTKDVHIKSPNVITYGFTQNKTELAQLYTMADVFVNCTREDSFSLINVEAQACGTPIITFDNTGASETVAGVNSFRAKNGSVEGVYKFICKIKETQNLEIDSLTCGFVQEKFDKDNNYRTYIVLLQKCLE